MTFVGKGYFSTVTAFCHLIRRCHPRTPVLQPLCNHSPVFSCYFSTRQAPEDDSSDGEPESYEVANTTELVPEKAPKKLQGHDFGEPTIWDRRIPRTLEEFKSLAVRPARQIENPKYLRVSIVGAPNAGKSTLTNQIMGWRVCSTSNKVHTTRRNTMAVLTEENVQLVLVDTPGTINQKHGKKHHLERSLIVDPESSLNTVDLVAVLVDASKYHSLLGLDPLILSMLYKNPHMPSILVLNKVDLVQKKTKLLDICDVLSCSTVGSAPVPKYKPVESFLSKAQKSQLFNERFHNKEEYDPEAKFWADVERFEKSTLEERQIFISERVGWPKFSSVFMISALDGDGIGELKKYLMKSAHSADWRFNPEVVSNQSPKEIVLMAVREKLLEHLRMKLPYQIELFLTEWNVDDKGTLQLTVRLKVPRPGAMKHVVGEKGNRVREIAYEAGQEMMNAFRCEVLLKLVVSC